MRKVRLLLAVLALGLLNVPAAGADDYGDLDYLVHDLDNVLRSVGPDSRQVQAALDPDQVATIVLGGTSEWLSNLATQASGLSAGRVFVSLGQLLPGGNVGEPGSYGAMDPVEVDFASRTGALLHGRLWWDGKPGAHPAIVITSGSIQSPAVGYHWAAQSLAAAGYVVLTWDPQGQGESEMFGHAPGDIVPTFDGVPFQQEANFVDGTVDALRFLLSTPVSTYRPDGWTAAQASTHAGSTAGAGLHWHNPVWHAVDRQAVGLAGHSLGARAVSVVQQCSDASDRWRDVAACGGRSYPIRAVVGWDRLQGGGDVVPVVPGMDQQADGYFINPVPAPQAPSPSANLGAHEAWRKAGIDTYSITIRGGTHCEWSWIPVICAATSYGLPSVDLYTRAWFDRYLHPAPDRRVSGGRTLVDAPRPDQFTSGADQLPWRANFLSVRVRSAYACRCIVGSQRTVVDDIRAHVGLSPVGDWAGANRDLPAVRTP